MDLIQCLKKVINEESDIPAELQLGYLDATESLVIYSLPGSSVSQEYMDGAKDMNINYEIGMKSKDGAKAEVSLWRISEKLEKIKNIVSEDESFIFNKLTVTSKPFLNSFDGQGWVVFLLNFTVSITTYEGE